MANLQLGGSKIEALAAAASNHEKLGTFNMVAARQRLSELLAAIGKTAEFSTYTLHDISHVDALLKTADWLIPASSFAKLTTADALVITLSIYLHDLGMLVTRDEYLKRELSGFPSFKESIATNKTPSGIDLLGRLNSIEKDDREHFLYQEFVRAHHAERIEAWVTGDPHTHFGASDDAAAIVQEILAPLSELLREDIATIARSHHLSDLDDDSKYKLKRAYGQDADDIANIQYAAIVLRAADVLHMTMDRTPTIQYRLASPKDPMGQREWKKQGAIRAVIGDVATSQVEIHAKFADAEGFFALMEFLDYCDSELRQTSVWASDSIASSSWEVGRYEFPWTSIDRSSVESKGFEPRQFSFKLDQAKVLELLTGHTLYNDASVAIREVVQNAIDAVRLQESLVNGPRVEREEDILVTYDSESRVLRILDHGTGMTQQTIEDHFLKAGSSGYQTKAFRDKHPLFTPISRFGIGVLSAFMIADEVRVATIHSSQTTGRELVLKSVHGHYLSKEFDPASDYASRIGKHGTEIELKLRYSSGLNHDMLSLLERWIVIPRCKVRAVIDSQAPVSIGEDSVASALESKLTRFSSRLGTTRVHRHTRDGVDIGIAQVWNPIYQEWDLLRLSPDQSARERNSGTQKLLSSVCVQGIQVTTTVPGLQASGPIMVIDLNGIGAPKTNVARSDLEAGDALDALVSDVYSCLLQSIENQIPDISAKVSMRFALGEAAHIYDQATRSDRGSFFTRTAQATDALWNLPVHPVESDGELRAQSVKTLQSTGFLTLIGPAAEDAARFLEWVPKSLGLLPLLNDGGLLENVPQEDLPLLGDSKALFSWDQILWQNFRPSSLLSLEGGTSVLVKFEYGLESWASEAIDSKEYDFAARAFHDHLDRSRRNSFRSNSMNFFCTDPELSVKGLEKYDAVFIGSNRMFLPTSPWTLISEDILGRLGDPSDTTAHAEFATLIGVCDMVGQHTRDSESYSSVVSEIAVWLNQPDHITWPSRSGLIELAESLGTIKVWSSSNAWRARRSNEE